MSHPQEDSNLKLTTPVNFLLASGENRRALISKPAVKENLLISTLIKMKGQLNQSYLAIRAIFKDKANNCLLYGFSKVVFQVPV